MIDYLPRLTLAFFCFLSINTAFSQTNCSINAGVNQVYCLGQQSSFELQGGISGAFDLNSIIWSLDQQPFGSDVSIDNPNSLIATTSDFSITGDYVFSLSANCDIGMATQSVTLTVSDPPSGSLIFPDLNCIPVTQEIVVQKQAVGDAFFVYNFVNDGILQVVSETPTELILKHGNGRCFENSLSVIRYGVANSAGCLLTKQLEYEVPFYYDRDPMEIGILGNCIAFNPDCTVGGDITWTIEEAPQNSNASFEDINGQIGSLCDVIDGCYTISFQLSNTPCNDTIEYFTFCDKNDLGVSTFRVDTSFCEYPQSLLLAVPSPDLPHICTEWSQLAGPPLDLTQISHNSALVEGMESANSYIISFEEDDKLNKCKRIINFYLNETSNTIGDNLEVGEQRTSCFFGCSDRIFYHVPHFNPSNTLDYVFLRDVRVSIDYISGPQGFNLEDGIFLGSNLGNVGFDDEFPSRVLYFEELGFSLPSPPSFSICSDSPSGNYTFRIRFSNDCVDLEFTMDIQFFRSNNDIFLNAGTDQVLPCGQDSTSIVGNYLGPVGSQNEEFGYWTAISFPDNSSNPIQNINHVRILQLENLETGLYSFKYTFPINNTNGNSNCDYYVFADTVNVWVAGDGTLDLDPIDDMNFCIGEEVIVDLPFGGANVQVEQISGNPVNFEIIAASNQLKITQFSGDESYGFTFRVQSDCNEYEDDFVVNIIDAPLEQAIIETQDTCVFNIFGVQNYDLFAQPVTDGIGEWSYIGEGMPAVFTPDRFSNEVSVEFELTDYSEFIWTVSKAGCPNISQDKVIFRDVSIFPNGDAELEDIYRDCNASFPYTVSLDPRDAPFGAKVSWSVFSTTANQLPQFVYPDSADTDVVLYEAGTYILQITYEWEGTCDNDRFHPTTAFTEIKLSESGSPAYAGEDILSCELQNQLSANTPDSGEGFWRVIETTPLDLEVSFIDRKDPNTVVSFNKAGTAILEWSVSAADPDCGLSSLAEMTLTVFSFSTAETDITICGDDSYILNHDITQSGVLSFNQISGPTVLEIRQIDEKSTLISNIEDGMYELDYFYNVDTVPCELMDRITISKIANPLDGTEFEYNYCFDDIQIDDVYFIQNIPDDFEITFLEIIAIPTGADSLMPVLNATEQSFTYAGFDVSGEYVFNYQIQKGDCIFDGNLLFLIEDQLDLSSLQTDYQSCPGSTVELNGFVDGDYFYNWIPGNLVSDPSSPTPQFIGDVDAVLTLQISSSANFDECLTEQIITVTFVNQLDVMIAQFVETCYPEFLSFGIDPSLGYLIDWSFDPLFTAIAGTNNQFEFNADRDTVLYYRVDNQNGCTALDSILITGTELFAEVPQSIEICEPNEVITLTSSSPDPNLLYQWKDPNGENLASGANVELIDANEGVYTLCVFTQDMLCSDTLSTEVYLSDLYQGVSAFALPYTIEEGQQTQLEIASNIDDDCDIKWNDDPTLSALKISDPIASPLETTVYTVSVTKNACTRSDTVRVQVVEACIESDNAFVPNMFTPNGDGQNDLLIIEGDFVSIEMIIFNRWGQKVAALSNEQLSWDGMFNGQPQSVDVYGYDMTIVHCDGEEEKIKGNVSLIR